MDFIWFPVILIVGVLILLVGFIAGAGVGHFRFITDAVRKGYIDHNGIRYRVESAAVTTEMAAEQINNAVRGEMRRGQYDADIARINQRNNERGKMS